MSTDYRRQSLFALVASYVLHLQISSKHNTLKAILNAPSDRMDHPFTDRVEIRCVRLNLVADLKPCSL